jgi:hypothetical protein
MEEVHILAKLGKGVGVEREREREKSKAVRRWNAEWPDS